MDKPELLALVRRVAVKAGPEDFSRCILEGVDGLPQAVQGASTIRTGQVVEAMRRADLRLLLSDWEEGFAVMPFQKYNHKTHEAMDKNF